MGCFPAMARMRRTSLRYLNRLVAGRSRCRLHPCGEVSEWSIAAVLKTVGGCSRTLRGFKPHPRRTHRAAARREQTLDSLRQTRGVSQIREPGDVRPELQVHFAGGAVSLFA